jgi:hypothetical protein
MRFLSLSLLLVACASDKDGSTTDTSDTGGGGGGGPRTFADFVNVQTDWTGDTTCFDGTNFVDQVADPSCQVEIELDGQVSDFQTDDDVPDATVQVWSADDITGGSPFVTQADADGRFSATATACTPFAYGITTPPEWEETVDTYEVHQVYGYEDDGVVGATFNSVSQATSQLIPALIGVSWDETTAIIAGTAYDCNEEPIQYAQVFLRDAAGNPPATGDVFYFSESGGTSLPTDKASQPHTNTNGLWVAINVPAGTWTVEMWGWDSAAAAHVKLGATELQVEAGGVTISNIYTGDDDGIYLPASCLQACGG